MEIKVSIGEQDSGLRNSPRKNVSKAFEKCKTIAESSQWMRDDDRFSGKGKISSKTLLAKPVFVFKCWSLAPLGSILFSSVLSLV